MSETNIEEKNNAIFLLKSSQNSSFGTAFCVQVSTKGAFFVTCTHVVESCGQDFLELGGKVAKLLYLGSSEHIDLAVIFVEGLENLEPLALCVVTHDIGTNVFLNGFKPHKNGTHLKRALAGSIAKISEIHSEKRTIETYELKVEEDDFNIEKGYSGSAIVVNGQVIAVATDRNSNGKQAYAIPIRYLTDIWEEMPQALWAEAEVNQKTDFTQEVFASLDDNPLLLFSTDAYNHSDYIEYIRKEAVNIFGASSLLEINCGRFSNINDKDVFFQKLAKRLKLSTEVEDSIDFEDAIIEHFEQVEPLKTFMLVIGFERLQEDVRNAFAVSLRNLQEEYSKCFHLVIFGGEKLIQLKYSTGIHSYFNTFDQKPIPTPSFSEWKVKFPYLSASLCEEVLGLTGGYGKLSEYCFKAKVQSKEEAIKCMDESSWKSELFRLYRNDKLSVWFDKEVLGDAHPYSDHELLYRLYWDNLIVEEKGKFVWRSPFLVKMGKAFFGVR